MYYHFKNNEKVIINNLPTNIDDNTKYYHKILSEINNKYIDLENKIK